MNLGIHRCLRTKFATEKVYPWMNPDERTCCRGSTIESRRAFSVDIIGGAWESGIGACETVTAAEMINKWEENNERERWGTFRWGKTTRTGSNVLESGKTAFNWPRNRLWIKCQALTE